MGKSSAEIDRGPPQGAAEVSAKLPPAALESTLHVSWQSTGPPNEQLSAD